MTLEELKIIVSAETKQLNKGLDDVKNRVGKMETDVKKRTSAIGGAFKRLATVAVAALSAISFKNAMNDAKQYEASIQQIGRLLGSNASSFERWATTQGKALGMARLEAVKYGATYANLLHGISRDSSELTTRTQDLLQASSIVASATGRTIEDVMERIRSGLLGNTEAIEDLGINVNVALIETTNAFKQFANGKSWQQLDFNLQQTIRYYAILEQAAAKYGNELAQNTNTRQAKFIAHLKDAKLYLGQAFLPIYNAILPALTSMAEALARVTQQFSNFMQAIFGKVNTGQKVIEGQANAVTELGNAYGGAGKKANKALASFDQNNLVGGTTSGGGGGSSSGLSPSTTEFQNSAQEMSDEIDKLREKLLSLISEGAKEEIEGRVTSLTDSFNSLRESWNGLKGNPEFAAFMEKVKLWAIDNVISRVSFALLGLDGTFKILDGTIKFITGLFSGDFQLGFEGFETTISGFNDLIIGIIGVNFPGFAAKLEEFSGKVGEAWKLIKDKVTGYGDETKLEVSDFGDYIKDVARTKVEDFKNSVKTKFNDTVYYVKQKVEDMRNSVSNKFNEIKTNALTKWDEIKKTVKDKIDEITGLNVDDLKTTLSTTWDSIKLTASNKWGGVVTTIKSSVNEIINLINKMIRGVNKFSIDVPDFVSKIPGVPDDFKGFKFNIPEIPKLAVGTNYVERDGLAFLHEGEAVVPKAYNPAVGGMGNAEVVSMLKEVVQAVNGIKEIKAVISQQEAGRGVVGYINNEVRRGLNPLNL